MDQSIVHSIEDVFRLGDPSRLIGVEPVAPGRLRVTVDCSECDDATAAHLMINLVVTMAHFGFETANKTEHGPLTIYEFQRNATLE